MDRLHETTAFRNSSYFEYLASELNKEHDNLLDEVREILEGTAGYSTKRFKNPRLSSTGLPLRQAVLRKNIICNQEAYNAAAAICLKLMLKLHLDRLELQMVQDAMDQSWQDFEERKGSGNLYKGHRTFMDRMFQTGIAANDLLSLDAEESAAIAEYIGGLLARRTDGSSPPRLPEAPS